MSGSVATSDLVPSGGMAIQHPRCSEQVGALQVSILHLCVSMRGAGRTVVFLDGGKTLSFSGACHGNDPSSSPSDPFTAVRAKQRKHIRREITQFLLLQMALKGGASLSLSLSLAYFTELLCIQAVSEVDHIRYWGSQSHQGPHAQPLKPSNIHVSITAQLSASFTPLLPCSGLLARMVGLEGDRMVAGSAKFHTGLASFVHPKATLAAPQGLRFLGSKLIGQLEGGELFHQTFGSSSFSSPSPTAHLFSYPHSHCCS